MQILGKGWMRSVWQGLAWDKKLMSLEGWTPPRVRDKGTWVQILQVRAMCLL